MSAPLIRALNQIPYNLTDSYEENEEKIREDSLDLIPFLDSQFTSPGPTLTIYYPYVDQFIPVTYNLPPMVAPKLILQSITNFYMQDLNDDQINWLVSQGISRRDLQDRKVYEILGTEVFFEGVEPYNSGWLIRLGT